MAERTKPAWKLLTFHIFLLFSGFGPQAPPPTHNTNKPKQKIGYKVCKRQFFPVKTLQQGVLKPGGLEFVGRLTYQVFEILRRSQQPYLTENEAGNSLSVTWLQKFLQEKRISVLTEKEVDFGREGKATVWFSLLSFCYKSLHIDSVKVVLCC